MMLAHQMNLENSPHLVVPDPAVLDMLYSKSPGSTCSQGCLLVYVLCIVIPKIPIRVYFGLRMENIGIKFWYISANVLILFL
jgi:hypothetical protein